MSTIKSAVFSFLLLGISLNAFCQSDSIILKIGNKSFTHGEFDYIYNKNNKVAETKKGADEYLQLFTNYKLKVTEAEAQGFDTLVAYKNELSYYKAELIKPYLTDKNVTEDLLQEAYNHLGNEVDASHILILIPRNPTPADTLKAYNKILAIQKQLQEGGDFAQIATTSSEDPSAAKNSGRLGYFSGFMMVYPFEKAAYLTPVGQVSPIVRTQFGYHLIFVHGTRKARGEVRAAHIMKVFPRNSSQEVIDRTKLSIDSIYAQLMNGAKFEDMASQYSEDGNTARKGGELQWFGTSQMIPEFANPAFELKNDGDISKPIQTPYGWHIIKRLEARGLKPYSEMKPELEKRIGGDERAYSGQNAVISRLKIEYGFVEDSKNFELLTSLIVNPTINDADFYDKNTNNSNLLFSFATKTFTVEDFKAYLKTTKKFSLVAGIDEFIKAFHSFQNQSILAYETSILDSKYPDYKYLLDEYHDGLLIFDISKKEIWDKASADTLGLLDFYNNNKTIFTSHEAFVGRIFYCKDKATLKVMKEYKDAPKNVLDSIVNNLNLKEQNVSYLHGSFAKGDNELVDKEKFKTSKDKPSLKPDLKYHLLAGEMKMPTQLTFAESKGMVISEYQTYLDLVWVKALREKYKPQIGKL